MDLRKKEKESDACVRCACVWVRVLGRLEKKEDTVKKSVCKPICFRTYRARRKESECLKGIEVERVSVCVRVCACKCVRAA